MPGPNDGQPAADFPSDTRTYRSYGDIGVGAAAFSEGVYLTARLATAPQSVANTGSTVLEWQVYDASGDDLITLLADTPAVSFGFWESGAVYALHFECGWEEDATGGRRIGFVNGGGSLLPFGAGNQVITHAEAFRTGDHWQYYDALFTVIDLGYADTENPNGSLSVRVQQDSAGALDITFAELQVRKVLGA